MDTSGVIKDFPRWDIFVLENYMDHDLTDHSLLPILWLPLQEIEQLIIGSNKASAGGDWNRVWLENKQSLTYRSPSSLLQFCCLPPFPYFHHSSPLLSTHGHAHTPDTSANTDIHPHT